MFYIQAECKWGGHGSTAFSIDTSSINRNMGENEKNEFRGLSDETRKILQRVEQEYANSSLGDKERSLNNEEISRDEPAANMPQVVVVVEDKAEENATTSGDMKKCPEYNWKIERLMNDEVESKAPSFAPSDFMSLAQSDIVNVDDSISQIDYGQCRAKTPTLPKALADMNSEVSQSTEKLLAIQPQSIMINATIDENSVVSLQTEHMAAEFNRVQRSMDVNFGMAPRSTVSTSVSNVSMRTEVIQREILDILGTRARKLGVLPPPEPSDRDSHTSLSQSTVKSRTSQSDRARADLKKLYDEKKQVTLIQFRRPYIK